MGNKEGQDTQVLLSDEDMGAIELKIVEPTMGLSDSHAPVVYVPIISNPQNAL